MDIQFSTHLNQRSPPRAQLYQLQSFGVADLFVLPSFSVGIMAHLNIISQEKEGKFLKPDLPIIFHILLIA